MAPYLTDKVNEAIASPARFRGEAQTTGNSADRLATQDYKNKMAEIFQECRRVIKSEGIMTVMFTHKDTDAWDALTVALIESGFGITRTWPVKTEAGECHQHQGPGCCAFHYPAGLPTKNGQPDSRTLAHSRVPHRPGSPR